MSREEVIAMIADELGIPESEIIPEATLDSLSTDSLETSYLMLELEARSGLILTDEEMQKMLTVKDILARMVTA